VNDRGAARVWLALLLGTVAVILVFGCHLVTYSRLAGGRKVCLLTKDRPGLSETFISAPNEMKLALQHPMLAARLASGSGMCVQF
jgi:hypothetical protein